MSTNLLNPAPWNASVIIIDAAGKPLGRTAATAAVLLRGKNKVTFTPNVDCGVPCDHLNCDQLSLPAASWTRSITTTTAAGSAA
jgi:large subunit ribosomal protein L13